MFSPYFSSYLTVAFYFLASAAGFYGLLRREPRFELLGGWLATAAFVCQTLYLFMGFHALFPEGPSVGAYLQLLAWFCLLCGLVAWRGLKSGLLIPFATAFGTALFLLSLPYLETSLRLPPSFTSAFYALHIGAIFLSIGLLSVAFVASCVFLFMQKKIKNKQSLAGVWRDMPALAILDKVNFVCILLAFPLFTLGVVCGFVWSSPVFGSMWSADPKKIVTLIAWATLAVVFHNRLVKGWRGKKPAILTVAVFLLCVFSILVVNFYFSTQHSFPRD